MFLRNASIGLIAAALAACSQDAADDSVDDGSQNATESTYELFFTNPIPQMLAAGTVTDGAKDANGNTWSDLAKVDVGEGRKLSDRLVRLIGTAKGTGCSVLMADYDFTLTNVAQALADAKGRGCDVTLI